MLTVWWILYSLPRKGRCQRHCQSLPYLFSFLAWKPMNSLMKESCSAAGETMVNQMIKSEETGQKRRNQIIILTFLDIRYGNSIEGTFLVGYPKTSVLASLPGLSEGWLVQSLINLSFAAPLEGGTTHVGVSVESIRPNPPQPLALIGSPGKTQEKLSILKTVFVCDFLRFLLLLLPHIHPHCLSFLYK